MNYQSFLHFILVLFVVFRRCSEDFQELQSRRYLRKGDKRRRTIFRQVLDQPEFIATAIE